MSSVKITDAEGDGTALSRPWESTALAAPPVELMVAELSCGLRTNSRTQMYENAHGWSNYERHSESRGQHVNTTD